MPCSFTLDHYEEILKLFKDHNYKFVSFTDYKEDTDNQLILRHDIDFSPDYALKIAEIENALEVQSNYHFLISSEMYNLFSKDVLSIIKQIKGFNHSLGLHFDPSAFESMIDKNQVKESIKYLKLLFTTAETALGKLDAYSFHRPATYGMSEKIFTEENKFEFPLCAYDEKFTKKILYRSDSRREWRNGCICKQIDKLEGKSLQLLIHPIWWTENVMDRSQNLIDFKIHISTKTEKYLQNNLSFYDNKDKTTIN